MQEYVPVYIPGDSRPYGSVRPFELKVEPVPMGDHKLTPDWHREFAQLERQVHFEIVDRRLRLVVDCRETAEKLAGFKRSPEHPSWVRHGGGL